MIYINSTSSISYATTADGQFPETISFEPSVEKDLQAPIYKEIINPSLLRRMSPVVRMGVACAARCIQDTSTDGIIVGTGLGCLKDTEKFLVNFVHSDDGTLSPTSFIQSTHNTIAGQIALIFKNHGYNMTHVQNGISFETALLDAFLQIQTKEANSFIVGAVDEKTPILDTLCDAWGMTEIKDNLSEGSSFFRISTDKDTVQIKDVHCVNQHEVDLNDSVKSYLLDQNLANDQVSILYLHNAIGENSFELEHTNITSLCGQHFSNPAFGLHLATSLLEEKTTILSTSLKDQILVVNNYNNKQLGLVLVSK